MFLTINLQVSVNHHVETLEVLASSRLLDVLRDRLDLTGTKECCAEGECGACSVLIDGRVVNSCLVLAVEADGCEITTIEGLAVDGQPSPLQVAFLQEGAVQCGFCIPGMVVAAQYLLEQNPHPTPSEIREGLSGNLCRCAGYNQICEAVLIASKDAGQ